MTLASAAVQEVLLLLKVLFLVLLYLFIWWIVRGAGRQLQVPQESFVLSPREAGRLLGQARVEPGRLVVVSSPARSPGEEHVLDSAPLTVGRDRGNDVGLEADSFSSTHHARFEPRRDGVWVVDLGSTNGTYVNGTRISTARRLMPGDVIRIGETDLRFEP